MNVFSREPFELLASYPSRSRYPRGFLWDEGFHLLLICQWSDSLCVEIFRTWFDTISEQVEGEIMREQARGDEARFNIPLEDQPVKSGALSSPTMFLPLSILFERGRHSPEVKELVMELYPKFNEWYGWYEQRLLGISIPCTFSYR